MSKLSVIYKLPRNIWYIRKDIDRIMHPVYIPVLLLIRFNTASLNSNINLKIFYIYFEKQGELNSLVEAHVDHTYGNIWYKERY